MIAWSTYITNYISSKHSYYQPWFNKSCQSSQRVGVFQIRIILSKTECWLRSLPGQSMIGSQFNVRMLWRICSVLDPGNVNKLLSPWSQHWTNLQTWRFFSLRIIVLSLTHFHHIQSIDNNIQSRNETEIIWSSFLLEQDSHSQLKRIQNIFGWTAPTSRPAFTPLAPVWEKLTKAYSVRLSSTEAHESFNLNKQKKHRGIDDGGPAFAAFCCCCCCCYCFCS